MPHILTLPRTHAPALPVQGCWAVDDLSFLQHAQWQSRAQAEHNDAWLQPIAYLLLRNALGHIWCYQRSGGDARLDGRCSCGVGGHVDAQDAEPPLPHNYFNSTSRTSDRPCRAISPLSPQATLRRALLREVAEELGAAASDLHNLSLQGLIYEGLSAVGRVHLGLLFTAQWLPDLPPRPVAGEALLGLGFRPASDIANNDQFELWSRLAAQYLL
jgi:predicted NUDIX family phosphoesterase